MAKKRYTKLDELSELVERFNSIMHGSNKKQGLGIGQAYGYVQIHVCDMDPDGYVHKFGPRKQLESGTTPEMITVVRAMLSALSMWNNERF